MAQIFVVFLMLGLTAFGGPVAHIGYFREALVARRRWIGEEDFARLFALCQILPGPSSSQLGFAIGWRAGGLRGALAAFAGFTLPAALILAVAAALYAQGNASAWAQGAIHGLKLAAVAVVAHAVQGMARSLAPQGMRAAIALVALALCLALPGAAAQIGAIILGAMLALFTGVASAPLLPATSGQNQPSRRMAMGAAGLLAVLVLMALWPWQSVLAELARTHLRAGGLVFGGGHVVLPLLEGDLVGHGLVSRDAFLAGYAAAQAVPGPLFSFAAWSGQIAGGWAGALLSVLAIFVPGFLLLVAVWPVAERFEQIWGMRVAIAGANAAVVGVLGAALYDPVFVSAVQGRVDLAIAVALWAGLAVFERRPIEIVALAATSGVALTLLA